MSGCPHCPHCQARREARYAAKLADPNLQVQLEIRRKAFNATTRDGATRHAKAWTLDELKFLEDHPELTARQLAPLLGRTWHAVKNARSRSSLRANGLAGGVQPRETTG